MRHLTDSAKRCVLQDWESAKAAWRAGLLEGVGSPDPEIIPWCDRINRLPGICTLQSCSGHRKGRYITDPAHLWLWLSQRAAASFAKNAIYLAEKDFIEEVATLYTNDRREIASIRFWGNERDFFNQSIREIFDFLEHVSADYEQFPALSFARHSLSSSPDDGRPGVEVSS